QEARLEQRMDRHAEEEHQQQRSGPGIGEVAHEVAVWAGCRGGCRPSLDTGRHADENITFLVARTSGSSMNEVPSRPASRAGVSNASNIGRIARCPREPCF